MRTIAEYLNRYKGRRFVIVGKGPTQFRYENLAEVADPVIFINDAVQFEGHAKQAPETFFFAHDKMQGIWLDRIKSTAVLPLCNSVDCKGVPMVSVEWLKSSEEFRVPKDVVAYGWDNNWREDRDPVKSLTREQIAESRNLFIGNGTIQSAIHFAWLCGASEIDFVGCDGFMHGEAMYDKRVNVLGADTMSDKTSEHRARIFSSLRRWQDWLCEALQMPTLYVNERYIEPRIPKRAHFIWFGVLPDWVEKNVASFKEHHPDWKVTLWRRLPGDLPDDLLAAYNGCQQVCQQKDILSYWLLLKHGGIFLDADMVTVRSMEPLRRFDAWGCRTHCGHVNCAALGAVKGSAAMTRVLAGVVENAADEKLKGARTRYGPGLLTRLFGMNGDGDADFAVLPRHYFYLLPEAGVAHSWWNGDPAERARIMAEHKVYFTDATKAYAVHLWGVENSGHRKVHTHRTALEAWLSTIKGDVIGAEVGVLAGRLSAHLLETLPRLTLYMVDSWCGGDRGKPSSGGRVGGTVDRRQAAAVTEAYKDRRHILHGDSIEMAVSIDDGALDFVFLDANHTYEAVARDLRVWYPKVKSGGTMCGHDWENPCDKKGEWGVKRAVEEFRAELGIDTMLELGDGTTWFFEKPE